MRQVNQFKNQSRLHTPKTPAGCKRAEALAKAGPAGESVQKLTPISTPPRPLPAASAPKPWRRWVGQVNQFIIIFFGSIRKNLE
jgi:hypothetical protein